MRTWIVAAGLFFSTACIAADLDRPRLPEGVTCEMVRHYVAEYGEFFVRTSARIRGYSKRDVREAMKCLILR